MERGLLNLKRQQSLDRKRTKEEKELYQRTRVFMRYQTMEEHEALVAGLNDERKLRQRIEELQVAAVTVNHPVQIGVTYDGGCHVVPTDKIYDKPTWMVF